MNKNDRKTEGTISKIRELVSGCDIRSGRKVLLTKTIRGFSGQLQRIEPLLNTKGIIIERLQRTSRSREIVIRVTDEAHTLAVQEYYKRKQDEHALELANKELSADEANDIL